MQVTPQLRTEIQQLILADYDRKKDYYDYSRHARALDINPSIYSRLKKGETDGVLSDSEWVRLGMELTADHLGLHWHVSMTQTYQTLVTQLEFAKQRSINFIFCDDRGLGKSFACKMFALANPNVAYVDCSQVKAKTHLIREIARKFGIAPASSYAKTYKAIVENVRIMDAPYLILDEAGDLEYPAFLEIKALWNALENILGCCLVGANGLKAKMNRGIENNKVGFEEIFDRFGNDYQAMTKNMDKASIAAFKRSQAAAVLSENVTGLTKSLAFEIMDGTENNLRNLRKEIVKRKNAA